MTFGGINLITLYYTDLAGVSVPVNYRLNDKNDGKTKHDYFREMLFCCRGVGVAASGDYGRQKAMLVWKPLHS